MSHHCHVGPVPKELMQTFERRGPIFHVQSEATSEMGKSKVNFESYFVLLVMLPTLTLLYFVYISYEQLLLWLGKVLWARP